MNTDFIFDVIKIGVGCLTEDPWVQVYFGEGEKVSYKDLLESTLNICSRWNAEKIVIFNSQTIVSLGRETFLLYISTLESLGKKVYLYTYKSLEETLSLWEEESIISSKNTYIKPSYIIKGNNSERSFFERKDGEYFPINENWS